MFDCYHIQIVEGDISRRLAALLPIIGHVQIASVPDRAEPDQGELDYRFILNRLKVWDIRNPSARNTVRRPIAGWAEMAADIAPVYAE